MQQCANTMKINEIMNLRIYKLYLVIWKQNCITISDFRIQDAQQYPFETLTKWKYDSVVDFYGKIWLSFDMKMWRQLYSEVDILTTEFHEENQPRTKSVLLLVSETAVMNSHINYMCHVTDSCLFSNVLFSKTTSIKQFTRTNLCNLHNND